MLISEILKKKRDGFELTRDEIKFFVEGLNNSNVSDLQAAAFLMASCICGLSPAEISQLTFSMRDSGKKFDFTSIPYKKVDKHSTGGVGDKISLLITPLCMAFDVAVPMISGRGLGHTGGTVDKLESITGFRIRLDTEDYAKLLHENGVFMACQTDDIAPADKKLYHIRDVTGTVESVGLITASILSKKLVEDLDALVIDMKVGNGAFMKSLEQSRELASSMIDVARQSGLAMTVIFSSMEQPLGNKIGNWLEIEETMDSLKGNCPDDIKELTLSLTASMLVNADIFKSKAQAIIELEKVLNSGIAFNNFVKMIESQGGDLESSKRKYENYPNQSIFADKSGYIQQIDTLYVGIAGIMLGGGRRDINDRIDYGAGIILNKKIGDRVEAGEEIALIQSKDTTSFCQASDYLKNCLIIGDSKPEIPKLILDEWTA
ncbi:MAG: thymidine phosphorylase [Candidatus Kapabacteria bacterium]|nr:thymidine phosphorylase [Ignavibacteriota bacterium]MCW5885572.1 thymidine phosphorylase [Candidatus Kapabacteria bacterium]